MNDFMMRVLLVGVTNKGDGRSAAHPRTRRGTRHLVDRPHGRSSKVYTFGTQPHIADRAGSPGPSSEIMSGEALSTATTPSRGRRSRSPGPGDQVDLRWRLAMFEGPARAVEGATATRSFAVKSCAASHFAPSCTKAGATCRNETTCWLRVTFAESGKPCSYCRSNS